ncbi:MAG TPA: hypothetical protein VMZ74_12325 [Ramlibacter sp.]|nr:hypothetical protein [Ramlibacter sp.]
MRFASGALLLAFAALAHAAGPEAETDALSPQGVSGEILDIAVEHCRRGEQHEALAMFRAIRDQLDPPQAIRQLILDMEASGCNRPPLAEGASLRLQVTGGWDSNVSQGISARTLVLGSGENTIELTLDPSYRPRSAAFTQASVDYSLVLPRYGVNLQVALGQRINFGASAFDLRTLSAAAAKEFTLPAGTLRAQVEASNIWLGNVAYQHSENAGLQWLYLMPTGAWLATLQSTAVQYVTQPLQNATVWEMGLLREWRLDPARSVHVRFNVQRDDAHSTRPGGDRFGYQLEVGAVVLTHGWRLRPQLGYSSWNSAEVFAPGLLDVRRRNRLRQAYLQAERPVLNDKTSLVLEWRGRWAKDTVSLYKYQEQMLSATLAIRF